MGEGKIDSWEKKSKEFLDELRLVEGIDDANAFEFAVFLEVFGKKHGTAALLRSAQDQSIPERNAMKPVQVNRCQNVRKIWGNHVKFCQELDLTPSDILGDVEFSSSGDEIFLQDLHRYHARELPTVLRE